ncbi:MAG: hypothetical protein JXA42_21305 [Anaerolineales bacterium]|nr:hypothetical protein [Anaerolineales bacterium]
MKQNHRLGTILAIIGALMGIIGHFVLFMNWYEIGMAAESAEPGCEILLKYIMPVLFDVGILGGVLYAVSAYGFITKSKWAFPLSVIATVLALQGGWFINVPFMAADLPPVYFTIFWPYLALYFFIMRGVGRVSWNRILVGLVSGMCFVFCFMNGIASTSRIITIGTPIFAAVQRLHWFAMIGWGVVTVKLLLKPTEWMRIAGITAGLLELTVGIPLAIATAIMAGRFSMFSLAPIFSLALVILFMWPALWEKFLGDSGNVFARPETSS